jgi:EAL domain-containing protein (putative c-di-GMP-specific phosphodiesterase class I)
MEGETARAAVDELKALGVTLVIDDFGTGYSSLLYLRRLPVEVLKIDKSFVAGVGENAEDTAIVTGVIRLAQALGLRTVAEGVETVAQLERLAMLECEFGQGYYWSRPLPATSFEAWLGDFDATSRRETLAGVVTIDERAR